MPLPRLLDLLAPSRCLACRAPGPALCVACWDDLPWLRGPRCAGCGLPAALDVPSCPACGGPRRPLLLTSGAVALGGPVPALVRSWKDRGLAGCARLAARLVLAAVAPPADAALVPVPAVADRARWRGVDPPHALAAELAAAWQLPLRDDLLVRVGTRPQRGLDRRARLGNARSSFATVAGGRAPPAVVLVDDVRTTGATLQACAGLARAAGARRVEAVVLALATHARGP